MDAPLFSRVVCNEKTKILVKIKTCFLSEVQILKARKAADWKTCCHVSLVDLCCLVKEPKHCHKVNFQSLVGSKWNGPFLQDFFFFWTVLQDIWVVLFDTNTAANSQGKWRQFGRDSDHGKTDTQCTTISRRDAIYHHLWISVDHWGDFDRLFSISRENRIKLKGRRNSWGGYPWYKPSLKSHNAYISHCLISPPHWHMPFRCCCFFSLSP